jgi:hypothetical protein
VTAFRAGALLATGMALPIAACGSSSAGGAGSAAPVPANTEEIATGDTLTDFQKERLLGHYSTEDGASGFILDRTVSPFRAKLDGTGKVVTLAESGGPFNSKEYRSADGTIWIRIEENGTVALFQGPKQREGVNVVRDAGAKRLE